MAKPGRASQVGDRTNASGTRQRLVDAAISTLREDGFAGASARAIAKRADCNQGLIFYHFGTVVNLLLAALDQTSAARRARYQAAIVEAPDPQALAEMATDVYREDLDAGHIAVLAEMIAGAASTPGLGAEVSARIDPWIDFTETAITALLARTPLAAIVPPADAAYAIVAWYLGLEMLSRLDGDRTRAESLLDGVARASSLLGLLSAPTEPTVGTAPHSADGASPGPGPANES